MAIKVKLSPEFSEYAHNQEIVPVRGETIRECLDNLIELYPAFKGLIFDSDSSLIALVIHREKVIVRNKLDKPVTDHDEILLRPMIYGG